jgi:hypothetical protein
MNLKIQGVLSAMRNQIVKPMRNQCEKINVKKINAKKSMRTQDMATTTTLHNHKYPTDINIRTGQTTQLG